MAIIEAMAHFPKQTEHQLGIVIFVPGVIEQMPGRVEEETMIVPSPRKLQGKKCPLL